MSWVEMTFKLQDTLFDKLINDIKYTICRGDMWLIIQRHRDIRNHVLWSQPQALAHESLSLAGIVKISRILS